MKKGLTEIVFILDRSGSMHGLESDTVGGFNAVIEQQKKLPGEAYVSTVLFDNYTEVLYDRVDLREVVPMTERDYTVRGCTALLDALGGAIHHIENVHRYARPEDVPERTEFVIITDGLENASRIYSADQVRGMVKNEERHSAWHFRFLGANIDAVQTASRYGISADNAADYIADPAGTTCLFEAVGAALAADRTMDLSSASWKTVLEYDTARRRILRR